MNIESLSAAQQSPWVFLEADKLSEGFMRIPAIQCRTSTNEVPKATKPVPPRFIVTSSWSHRRLRGWRDEAAPDYQPNDTTLLKIKYVICRWKLARKSCLFPYHRLCEDLRTDLT